VAIKHTSEVPNRRGSFIQNRRKAKKERCQTGEVPNSRGAKLETCQTAEVQNSRGFGMQKNERLRTDLARTNNYNTQKINARNKN